MEETSLMKRTLKWTLALLGASVAWVGVTSLISVLVLSLALGDSDKGEKDHAKPATPAAKPATDGAPPKRGQDSTPREENPLRSRNG